jgi:hypothetical protein
MSDLEKLLREEAEHAEQNKDATPSSDAKIGRPGRDRAKVLSVRLNAKEYEQLTAQAELAGVGPSTLARSMILDFLNPGEGHAPIDPWVASVSERLSKIEARISAEGADGRVQTAPNDTGC